MIHETPTPAMLRTLAAIRELTRRGHCPSYEELRVAIGASSKSTVCNHVKALEACGLIGRTRYGNRGLRVLDEPDASEPRAWLAATGIEWPAHGHGTPFLSEERARDHVAAHGGVVVPLYEHPAPAHRGRAPRRTAAGLGAGYAP